jgi:hypothetical protein
MDNNKIFKLLKIKQSLEDNQRRKHYLQKNKEKAVHGAAHL